ncbi:Bug family tripartite tricarboxylate transporter substrate binding protein [Muricoccus pecuniae]|uniref:Tripartite-type tricarboxylate transporter receptor subunit TctC n=1 Tax=Muricoccus pecuniae TaxID=693023 RepID=A0A840YBS9_9PROT|nr:tripartite tricarboxylate transporter substrate-binding protein [Roseomonas pecuniae]MBB5696169.1 tripartite-type tricarboxylate transporter receptor subunit TctC [Roseomonas pecuniae]
MTQIRRRAALGAALATPFLGTAAFGQEWPARPVRLIVSFAAGGAADTAARAYGAVLAEILGQSVVIENRTGGNALIAASATLQSPADGYTLLVDAANQLTNPILMRDLPFNYATAFIPVSQLVIFPQVVAVKTPFPARTIAEFLDQARRNPGSISYGTPPTAGMGHLAGELLQQRAGIRLLHSPYRGGADAARDLASGTLDAAIITTSSVRPPVEGGQARVLAMTGLQRSASYPDAPTLAEAGLPGFDMNDWNGLFVPAGVPRPILQRMEAAVMEAARRPGVFQRLAPLGTEVVAQGEAAFRAFLARQGQVVAEVIRAAKITIS